MTIPGPVPIALPDLGTSQATVSLWHVRPGDRVFEGDRVVEVSIPGAIVDVPAPTDGVLVECLALAGDRLTPGQMLGLIQEERLDTH